MTDSATVQKAKQEAGQYLQELAAYMEPADKLTVEDLLADIAEEEEVNYCEKSRMGGTAQHRCMDEAIARFKKSPQAFVEKYLRFKSEEQRSIYQKMAEQYLNAATFYLQFLQDRNRYFEKTAEVHENFQRCFSILSAWDYLKLPAGNLPVFLKVIDCAVERGRDE